jgi:hypothetical protein
MVLLLGIDGGREACVRPNFYQADRNYADTCYAFRLNAASRPIAVSRRLRVVASLLGHTPWTLGWGDAHDATSKFGLKVVGEANSTWIVFYVSAAR